MTDADLRVTPLDVGFDLRRHGIAVLLTPEHRSASYDLAGETRVVEGTTEEIAAALRAAGYLVEVQP